MSATPKASRAAIYARIEALCRADPTLSSVVIARRMGVSHVTVRAVLRAAGIYRDMRLNTNRKATP